MRPKIKCSVIYQHWDEYSISIMCKFFEVSPRGHYSFIKRLNHPENNADLAAKIQECQNTTEKRVAIIGAGSGCQIESLKEIRQQVYKYENLLARQFCADRANAKWATDISHIHTKEDILYLSIFRDLYDDSIISYQKAFRQTFILVLDTICLAMKKRKKRIAVELQLHSDQDFQYISQAYFKLTQS